MTHVPGMINVVYFYLENKSLQTLSLGGRLFQEWIVKQELCRLAKKWQKEVTEKPGPVNVKRAAPVKFFTRREQLF